MKFLNLGCGSHFVVSPEWTNIDFESNSEHVKAHNLLTGIPQKDNSFDIVYHSHVLEHFTKSDGDKFIGECFRVLKPGGILRIVIPDLEQITRAYLKFLELGLQNPGDPLISANYDWMLLEMYDQTVRERSGGDMKDYLSRQNIINEKLVFERIGEEGKAIRNAFLSNKNSKENSVGKKNKTRHFLSNIKQKIKNKTSQKDNNYDFRKGGEIHLWMYDKYSIMRLLTKYSFKEISFVTAFEGSLQGWKNFELDGKDGIVRKPDSLFTEAKK